jgi:uncharacterized protein (DUF58 family)
MTPRIPLVLALAAWTAIGVAAAWLPVAVVLWAVVGVLIGGIALADWLALRRLPDPRIQRRIGRALPLGVLSPVTLELTNPGGRMLRLRLHDLHPPGFAVRGLPADLTLGARERAHVEYGLCPPSRGDFPLTGCAVATRSPLGLWRRTRSLPPAATLRVFPNFAAISRYTLLAANDQLAQMGVRRVARRGTGAEFRQLREYREGDSLRQIDWKATSRMRKLISREYQDERDQRLLFLLDCGRRMRHRDAVEGPGGGQVEGLGRGHLDEALNALLLLAYVAVRQGDAVGLMTYGGPHRWFAPRKGPATVNRLLHAVYDLQPGLEAADPLAAARTLLAAMPRRALVVILTNSRDEDQEGLAQAAQLLRRRHLVVVADLREAVLDRALETPIANLRDALRFHAVQGWLAQRQLHQERLRHLGVQALDLLPEQLPVALVNRYFEIKRAGLL